MKYISIHFIFFFLLISVHSEAQIQNGSFETWTNGSPSSWFTTNLTGIAVPITQSTDAYAGSSAVRGEVVAYFNGVIAPILQAGNWGSGFIITEKINSFKGYFKFSPVSGDILVINIVMYAGGDVVGHGSVELASAMNSYTEVNVPVTYGAGPDPNKIVIHVFIAGPSSQDPHIGSFYFADDFSVSTTVLGVNDLKNDLSFNLEQNYPNPFNPVTNIKYTLPAASEVVFTVYNTLGNEVSKQTFFRTSGEHNLTFHAEGLSSGVYFYNIKAGDFTSTKKFILMK